MGQNTNGPVRKANSLDGFKLWFEDLPPKQKRYGHKVAERRKNTSNDNHLELKDILENNSRFKFATIYRPIFQWSKGIHLDTFYGKRWILTLKDTSLSILGLTFRQLTFIMNTVIKRIERNKKLCNELQYNIKKAITKLRSSSSRKDGMKMFNKAKKDKAVDKSANSGKTVAKAATNSKKWYQHSFVFGILGIYTATVMVSIAYSCVIISQGLEGITPLIMLAPQASFFMLGVLAAFWKLFK